MRIPGLLLVVLSGLQLPSLAAQDLPTPLEGEQIHVVRRGDTLWDLARGCLRDPFLWAEIYRMNAGTVQDPARIYPGQRIVLPDCAALRVADEEAPPARPATPAREGGVFVPRVAVELPVVRPGDFFGAAILVEDREVPALGDLVDKVAPTVVPLEITQLILPYDRVLVRLADTESLESGDPLQFFRRERQIRPYGRVYVPTGIGVVERVDAGIATVVIRTLYSDVRVGDAATRPARFPVEPGIAPGDAAGDLEGLLVGLAVAQPLVSTEDLVFLDLGEAAGVAAGDEFEIYLPPRRQWWGLHPETVIGRAQVVRVTGNTATARVIEVREPAIRPGVSVRRVARMP